MTRKVAIVSQVVFSLLSVVACVASARADSDSKLIDDALVDSLAAVGVPWTTTEATCCAKAGGWPIVCDGGRICGCDFSREGNSDYYFHCLRISPKPAPIGPVEAN